MYTRRIMEGVILTAVLLVPAGHMFKLWFQKHIVTTTTGPVHDAAAVANELLS